MHSQWLSSTTGLYELNKACSFNQFNVHTIDNETIAKVKEAAGLLSEIDFTNLTEVPPHVVEMLQKICTYYAFNERNLEQSLLFLNKLKKLTTTDVQRAYVDTLIGYANTIDPTFNDNKVFEDALALFPKSLHLEKTTSHDYGSVYPFILKGMAMRYLGLMMHRKGIEADKKNDTLSANFYTLCALESINAAIDLERKIQTYYPLAILSLAESLHIKGVMHIRVGECDNNRDEFEKALVLFQDASEKEKAFCQQTGQPHFLLATTLQSLAKTQMHLGQYKEAIQNLNAAYLLQVQLFNTFNHPDIAKTLHFKADVFAKQNDFASAVDAYMDTLMVRKQIKYRDSFFVDMTIKALKTALNELAKVDEQKCIAKYKQIHTELVKVDKGGEFTKYCYAQMMDLRDRASYKSAANQRQFSPVLNRNKEEEKPVLHVESKFGLK